MNSLPASPVYALPSAASSLPDISRSGRLPIFASIIVATALTYNWPLSLLNAHVVALSRNSVIAVETLIIASAFIYTAANWQKSMTRWALLAVVTLLLFSFMTAGRDEFAPKDVRDLLIIVSFIMVGMTFQIPQAVRLLVIIHTLIVIVTLWEIIAPDNYSFALNAKQYYINTRGFEERSFFILDSNLFNAYRPSERQILPSLGWLRASSVFLEPVGLGNYCAVMVLFLTLVWSHLKQHMKIYFAASWLFVLVASDGRFAAITSLLLIALSPLLRRMPGIMALIFLPVTLALSATATIALHFNRQEDTLPGRIARSIYQLGNLDMNSYLGFNIATPALADSGISYLIVSQSLFGTIALLLFLFFRSQKDKTHDWNLATNGAGLLFILGLLVSNSILSIKTGALLWLIFGLVNREQDGHQLSSKADQW